MQILSSKYTDQVKILIGVIPFIAKDKRFAIKGGTAINLFLLDMPRLSVDIDLCYLPFAPRDQALSEITHFVKDLSQKLRDLGFKTREKKTAEGFETTLFIQSKRVEVKVEINLVVRGAVYEPIVKSLIPRAVEQFEQQVEILCLDSNDLFAGKMCAALDRQHPRDFFDLFMFFKEFSYTRELHQAFIVYLLSSNRPISELINPNFLDIKDAYHKQFEGMSFIKVDRTDLEKTREKIFSLISSNFTEEDKEFLLSFKEGTPKWDLFPVKNAKEFPAIKWKLHNIQSMTPKNRLASLKKLEEKLGIKKP